jgi:hypothetical protein
MPVRVLRLMGRFIGRSMVAGFRILKLYQLDQRAIGKFLFHQKPWNLLCDEYFIRFGAAALINSV